MTTKEQIEAELEQMDEAQLDELYALIKTLRASRHPSTPNLMSKLKQIQIDAPADFAANLDLYMSGEKRADSDLR